MAGPGLAAQVGPASTGFVLPGGDATPLPPDSWRSRAAHCGQARAVFTASQPVPPGSSSQATVRLPFRQATTRYTRLRWG